MPWNFEVSCKCIIMLILDIQVQYIALFKYSPYIVVELTWGQGILRCHVNTSRTAPKWCSGLRHCISVLDASLQTLVRSWAASQSAMIQSPIGQRTIGTVLSGLGEGLAGVGRQL